MGGIYKEAVTMNKKQVKLLENMVKIPSPSGYEDKLAEFIKEELLEFLPKKYITIDFHKNVTAIIKGRTDHRIMIDAHADQIGFIVNNIDRKGFISLQYIGGGDTTILTARDLVILTDRGRVNAVVNRRHSHLVQDGEEETLIGRIHEAVVDIGPCSRAKVQAVVKIGDPVVYKPAFNQLRESYYSGTGMDDKSGCLILLETIKNIIKLKTKPEATLIFTFSAQEEIYGKKCRPLVKLHNPDLFIEVDVTFATDWEDDGDLERESGKCDLNSGIVLYRGVEIDRSSYRLLASIARNKKIKTQVQACCGSIGYTSTEMTHETRGIKALILGIPLRSMHTPVEIINMNDLNGGIRLLTSFLTHKKINSVLER